VVCCKILHLLLHRSNEHDPRDPGKGATRSKKRPAGRFAPSSSKGSDHTGVVSIRFGAAWW